MLPLVSKDLWRWIDENQESFQPPVGNKVIWEDSQFTAMIIRGPNARRDFHVDPSDEIFYMLKGDMILEYIDEAGQHQNGVIREGEIFLVPASVPHAPLAGMSSPSEPRHRNQSPPRAHKSIEGERTTMFMDREEESRLKRLKVEQAVNLAMQSRWAEAADLNRQLIESNPKEVEAYN